MPFNPDRINIHELTIEEPEKQAELPFDPEKDITPEDWREIRQEITRVQGFRTGDCELYMWAKILDPAIDLNLDTEKIKAEIKKEKEKILNRDTTHFLQDTAAIKVLKPEIDLGLNEKVRQELKNTLEEERKNKGWERFSRFAMRVKIIDPTIDIGLDEEAWQGMWNVLEKSRKEPEKGGWWVFSRTAMQMRILDNNIDLNLTAEDWDGIRSVLEEMKKAGRWLDFSETAFEMEILVAEEVKVPPSGGLEVIMQKDGPLKPTTPPMPETKQF